MPEGEKEEQEIGNLFGKNNERNRHVSPGSREIPNKIDAKRLTSTHIIITMPKVKDKERILKATRAK